MRCMKSRSTHAVVGLCGNDSTMTRGRGHESSQRLEQVLEEVLVGAEAHVAHLGAGEDRTPDVDRIRRARHERGVTRAEQHPHEVGEALLGPDGAAHLRVGIELDAELALVEVGDGHPQLRDAAAGRVPVVARVAHRLDQLVDRDIGRRHVGVAEAEVDDVDPGTPGLDLQGIHDAEDVGRQRVDPAEFHVYEGSGGLQASRGRISWPRIRALSGSDESMGPIISHSAPAST